MRRPAPTFELSVHFWRDPKVVAAGVSAAVLYIRCGCESRAHLTDGVVLDDQIRAQSTGLGNWKKLAEILVENDLWKRCKGGYRIPLARWKAWQLTSAQVMEIREFERDKKARQRERKSLGGQNDPSPDLSPGGPLGTSASASQSASASAFNQPGGPREPALRLDPPVPPGAPQRRRVSAAPWSWLAGWSPGPDDNPRSVLTRLGVGEPSCGNIVRAGASVERIIAVASDVHGDRRVSSPVRILVDRLQREYEIEKSKRGPLAGELDNVGIASLRNIERLRASRGAGP